MCYAKAMTHVGLVILAFILMLPGLIGLVIPVIPAVPYIFIVALVFGFVDRFSHLSGGEVAFLAVLAILSVVVDYLSGLLGAKYGGASRKALLFGFIGSLAGTFLLPPFGGLPGLFVGVALGELLQLKGQRQALKSATGGLLGTLAGMLINACIALLFLVLFIIFALH